MLRPPARRPGVLSRLSNNVVLANTNQTHVHSCVTCRLPPCASALLLLLLPRIQPGYGKLLRLARAERGTCQGSECCAVSCNSLGQAPHLQQRCCSQHTAAGSAGSAAGPKGTAGDQALAERVNSCWCRHMARAVGWQCSRG